MQHITGNWNQSSYVLAGAGTGKTSYLLNTASSAPPNTSLLFLAFNRRVAQEIHSRWKSKTSTSKASSLPHMEVKTIHGLAYQSLGLSQKSRVVPNWTPGLLEEVDVLKSWRKKSLGRAKKLQAIRWAEAALRFGASPNALPEPEQWLVPSPALDFLLANRTAIESLCQELLLNLSHYNMPLCHDAYLHLWLKQQHKLPHQALFMDEMQDLQPQISQWLLTQSMPMHWVGDPAQHIYAWRFAQTPPPPPHFELRHLNQSHRLSLQPTQLANKVLFWLQPYGLYLDALKPQGPPNKELVPLMHLFRTNLGLLHRLLELMDARHCPSIGMEGQSGDKLWRQEIQLLKDLIALRNGKKRGFKNAWLNEVADWKALETLAKTSSDHTLAQCMRLVKGYGKALPGLLQRLKKRTLPEEHRYQADWLGATVHSVKGLEYKKVSLASDFPLLSDVQKTLHLSKEKSLQWQLAREEAHIWYVAFTRAAAKVSGPGLSAFEKDRLRSKERELTASSADPA